MARKPLSQHVQPGTKAALTEWLWAGPLLLALMAILFTTIPGSVELTDVLVTATPDPEITVCSGPQSLFVEYVNSSSETLTGQILTLTLSEGLTYVAGSLDTLSGPSVIEWDLSDARIPVFRLDSLPPGEAVQFQLQYIAGPEAMTFVENGGTPRHTLLLETDQGSLTHQSAAYNMLYAALNLLTVNPVSQEMTSGDTATRSFQIINAGYGALDRFFVVDAHGTGLDWIAASMGSLSADGDSLWLSGPDFVQIGDGDSLFEQNESLTLIQTLAASGCNGGTVQSVIKTGWGCDALSEAQSSSANAYVSIQLQRPNLALTTQASMRLCFDPTTGDEQNLQIKNNGAGTAYGVNLDLYMSGGNGFEADVFARIDTASLKYRLDGGGWQAISPQSAQNGASGGDYACLANFTIGRANLVLPNIAPGATLELAWDLRRCCVNLCQDQNPAGWKADVSYRDFCQTITDSKSKVGESPISAQMNLFSETDPDIRDGERKPFTYTVSSYTTDFDEEKGAFELSFAIPDGLVWSGNLSDLSWARNGTQLTPDQLSYTGGTLTARYAAETSISLPKSEITLWLTGDCAALGEGEHDLTIDLNIAYLTDTTCATACQMPLVCGQPVNVRLHCPGPCTAGLRAVGYTLQRANFGAPDNNLDGLPDANGSLDTDAIKSRRAMVGDTILSTQTAYFHTDASHTRWDHAYAESRVELGTQLTVVGAQVEVFDQSSGGWLQAAASFTVSDLNTDREWRFDLSPASLASSNSAFQNVSYEAGDSLRLKVQYQVSGNIGGQVMEIDFDNSLYASENPQPAANERFSCGDYDGRFTLIGYLLSVDKRNSVTIMGCDKEIQQSFYLSIGDCCSNFAGGNLFPQEYRAWAQVNEIYTVIPPNYVYQGARMRQVRTKATNSTVTQSVNDLSISRQSGDTIWFNIDSLYTDQGGPLLPSDDGFQGIIWVRIAPTCDVTPNTWAEMPWGINFSPEAILGGGTTDWYTQNPDRVRFQPPNIALSSPAPKLDGLQRTITWELHVKNTTGSSMSNAWLHTKSPSGDMQLQAIIDRSSGDTLELTGDIFQLGNVGGNQTRKFDVVASYGACTLDFLEIYSGYECLAYPANFADFTCPYTSTNLYAEPQPAGFQVILNGQTVGDVCGNEVELTARILGTRMAHVDSLVFSLQIPGSQRISYQPASATARYPLSGDAAALPAPTQTGNTFTWVLTDDITGLQEAGLGGVLSIPQNEIEIKLRANLESNFKTGDFLEIKVAGYEACRQLLPQIKLAYDPSVTLSRSGLHELSGFEADTWGLAWGDYDGDGYEDVFVPEYSPDQSSRLYRNKGDGSFEAVIAAPLTTDRGSSPGAVWGDYDNDGDLDIFVPNNVQAVNHLYRNDGAGVFTKITEGSIANYGGYCHSASWIDYDRDGWLDLFVADYMPTRFNQLYHNNGDGTFTAQPGSALSQMAEYTLSASWSDINLDGLPDVVLVNDRGQQNRVFLNQGGGQFTPLSGPWDQDGGTSNGATWADYDRDGDFDLFIANASDTEDFFYENLGNSSFSKRTDLLFAQETGHSHGGTWGDIDNDGDLDLMVVVDQDQANRLYINQGNDQFVRPESPIAQDLNNSLVSSWNDLDRDGDLDIYVGNIREGNRNDLYINNRGQCLNWLCVELEGVRSNRDGVGALVKVLAQIDGQAVWQTQRLATHHGGIHTQNGFRLHYGLAEASQVDSIVVQWPSGLTQRLGTQAINGCLLIQEQNGQRVSGRVYYDANQNCVFDSLTDTGIPQMLIKVEPGGQYISTDAEGFYTYFVEAGAYVSQRLPKGNWTEVCGPDSHLTVTSGIDIIERNYALSNSCTTADLSLKMAATAMRRGFRNTMSLTYQNLGVTEAVQPRLRVVFPAGLYAIEAAPTWDSLYSLADSTIIIWRPATLQAQEAFSIQLTDSVGMDPQIGDPLPLKGSIAHAGADCNPDNNRYGETYEVTGALDPNDKLVFPMGAIVPGGLLTYRIRFQNVGNRPAERVTIYDTLSQELDISSLEQEVASHPYRFDILPGRVLRWDFPGIQLPDSVNDEPNSHGFVQFQIRALSALPLGQELKNRAVIEFDQRERILTNTTLNIVHDPSQLAQSGDISLRLYPNPALNYAIITLQSQAFPGIRTEIKRIELLNMEGKQIWSREVGLLPEVRVTLQDLTPEMYFVRAYDRYGFSYVTKLIRK